MLSWKLLLVSHRWRVVEGYLLAVQLTRQGGEKDALRTVVPKYSDASKWFSHRGGIEIGEDR